MHLKWLGHAAFALKAQTKTIIVDPFDTSAAIQRGLKFAYPEITGERADVVLVTHEHLDHNAVHVIAGSPMVIRAAGTFETPAGTVRGVASEHDRVAGTHRGMNAIYSFEVEGLRFSHFGDFGQAALRPEQVEAIGAVDVLLVPVGGGAAIDGSAAELIVSILRPRVIVPMHYRNKFAEYLPQSVDAFATRFPRVTRLSVAEFEITSASAYLAGSSPHIVIPAMVGT